MPGSLMVDAGPAAVLSPDGRTIVFRVSKDNSAKLFVRRLDQLEATELAGTENALNPFFSPDGASLGFFASSGLKTIPIAGGAVTTLIDAATGRGAAWAENGDIIFQSSVLPKTPLIRITAAGAPTDRGTTLAPEEVTHRWPQFLPGGKVLYSGNNDVSEWNNGTLRVQTEPGVPGKVVLRGGFHGRYVPTGHLLYVHAGTLYGVRFDPDRMETVGQPVPVIENVVTSTGTGGAQFSFAANGTLAYIHGDSIGADGGIYWMTVRRQDERAQDGSRRLGQSELLARRQAAGDAEGVRQPRPDRDLRLDQRPADAADLRRRQPPVSDLDAGLSANHLQLGRRPPRCAEHLLAARQRLRAGRPPHRQSEQPGGHVHRPHRYARSLFSEFAGGKASDIWILPLQANGKPGAPRPFLNTPTFETHGTFSADGKLVAYMSSEQGAFEIYVRTVDGAGGPWRVSTAGGAHPTWSTNTQELLYVIDDQIMTVKYRLKGDAFEPERARPWAPVRYATAGPTRKYALHPDGTRVVVATPDTTAAARYDTVTFVFNFFDELRRLLPAER